MNKKGLSEVVTTVLIILLVLAAIIIVWAVVKPMLDRSAQQINIDSLTSNLVIAPNSLQISPDNNVTLKVLRKTGEGNITGVNVILQTASGQRKTFKVLGAINELETKTMTIPKSTHGITEEITRVMISAIVEGANGEEVSSSITSGTDVPKPICGDGIIQTGEKCEGTNLNGQNCSSQTGYKYGTLTCTSSCAFDTSTCTPLSTSAKVGLIAYYPLSEGSGTTLNDLSGNGNTATIVEWTSGGTSSPAANPIWITGRKNKAVNLNGINQSIATTINLNTSKDFTYMIWINTSCVDRQGLEGCSLFQESSAAGRSFETWVRGNRVNVFGQFYDPISANYYPSLEASNSLNSNQWNQITFVYSSKVLSYYTNGNSAPVIQGQRNITDRDSTLRIGRDWGCCGSWYMGAMDDIAIWNRSLTTSEIADLYN